MNKLSEAVFGGPEQISREEARELLRSAGIDADTIADAVYARLYKQAQEYWMAQKPLPPLLKKAIEDLLLIDGIAAKREGDGDAGKS